MNTTAEHDVSAAGINGNGVVKSPDYTVTFMVDQRPDDAFTAINNVRGWWSEKIDGATDQLNGEFVFHNEPWHVAKIRVEELVPGKRVVWRVLENYMNFVNDTREWIGNQMVFEIARKVDKTEVVFTQIGLVPAYECYDACSDAWGGYIKGSLRSLIATGKGAPEPKAS
ncbi:MAG: SRPBCC domain-containing protein [Candidatus Limnocylindrales bacterium]